MATVAPLTADLFELAPLHQFSSTEYLQMIEKGVLGTTDRVELVGGFIVNMSPQGTRHNHFLMQLNRLFAPLHSRFSICVQGTLTVSEGQIFDPDFMLLRKHAHGYKNKLPDAKDAQLLVEAAESSLRFDQRIKLPAYAAAQIPEYWIADLDREVLIIHRAPEGERYADVQTRHGDDIVSALAAPELSFAVGEAFN